VRCSTGSATYAPESSALVWKIKQMPGGKEYLLRAKFSLPSVASTDDQAAKKPPIQVKFEIPYFTVSGVQVSARSLLLFATTPHPVHAALGLAAEWPIRRGVSQMPQTAPYSCCWLDGSLLFRHQRPIQAESELESHDSRDT
jgi:hypothetical protein